MELEFKIGHNILIGKAYYQIISIDLLIYKLAVTLAASSETTQKFDDNLEPSREFLYHIERVAVDGYIEFQLQFPESVPHWSPHGITQRLDYKVAGFPNGIYAPMVVMNGYYPSYNINNPKTREITADFWFWGWKYAIKQLTARPAVFTEVTNYAAGGGLG